MYQMVHLAIVSLSELMIAVVRAPFALTRGGASPVPLRRFYDSAKWAPVQEEVYVIVTEGLTASAGVPKLAAGPDLESGGL